MSRTVNIALIGYGFMGRMHSHAWHGVDKFFDLPAKPVLKVLVGRNQEAARAVAHRWGWEEVETDFRKAVVRDDVDLVDIVVPNVAHAEVALAALAARKAVACEKPLAMNTREARAMTAAAKRAGVLNTVWFNYRCVPAVALARQLVAERRLGAIHHVRALYLQDWVMDPAFPLVWRLDSAVAGSGSLGDLGAHIIDMAQFITGERITKVSAVSKTFVKRRPPAAAVGDLAASSAGGKKTAPVTVDDATLLLATFSGGGVGSFEATRFAAGRKNGNHIEINGSKGSLVFDFERMNELQFFSAEEPKHVQGFRRILVTEREHPYAAAYWPPGHIIGYEHTFTNHAADIIRGMVERTEVPPTFADATQVQAVLDAVQSSAASGVWTKVR